VEKMYAIFLNSANQILAIEILSSGTLMRSTIHMREIIKKILAAKAAAFVLTHNHPSGDVEPSHEDIETTRTIFVAGKIVDAQLFDHIIIGNDKYYSFSDNGDLSKIKKDTANIFKHFLVNNI